MVGRAKKGAGNLTGWIAVIAFIITLPLQANGATQPAFRYTRSAEPISILQIIDSVNRVSPAAFVHGGRESYMPVNESQLIAFLRRTKMERSSWQIAQSVDTSVEKVCTSYSLLLFALVEQERLRSRCHLPLAFCRVSLFNHSLNGFFNERGELKLVDPQLDQIFTLDEWSRYSPDDHDISVLILE